MGFRGQKYEVHGVPDGVFNIITSPLLQYNALFVFIGEDAKLACNKSRTAPWSHAGTYLGELGFQVGADQIRLEAGDCLEGMKAVEYNGKAMELGQTITIGQGACNIEQTVEYKDWDRVQFHLCEVDIELVNSNGFFNQQATITKRGWKLAQMHGLLGQTWRKNTYEGALTYVEGTTFDYQIADDELFGSDFLFNKFQTQQE
jgi:hypothetical protein